MGTSSWRDFHREDAKSKLNLYGRTRSSSANAPLAVVMGWLGAKERNVQRYAQKYTDMGYNALWSCAPASVLFAAGTKHLERYVRALIDVVDEFSDGGVILAPFSNAGAFVVRVIWESTDKQVQRVRSRIVAVVYDSCPAYMRISTGAQALLGGKKGSDVALSNWILAHCTNLYSTGMNIWRTGGSSDGGFWTAMKKMRFGDNCGELFIYSDDDHLCDARRVEEIIHSRPTKPLVLHFTESGHCRHGLRFPKEYAAALLELHQQTINPWRVHAGLDAWETTKRSSL